MGFSSYLVNTLLVYCTAADEFQIKCPKLRRTQYKM